MTQTRKGLLSSAPRLRRRDAILALGGAGLGAVALAAPPLRRLARLAAGELDGGEAWAQACTASPEQTEGPYFLDGAKQRRSITEQRPGTPLWVSVKVTDVSTCAIVPAALVDIWHADASGSYSGFNGADNDTFMRGRQVVGASGVATFRTVYPGWYPGRTPHIHVKVSVAGSEIYTGQMYFDEAITDAVYTQEPYSDRGTRDTRNATDGIFGQGGAESMLALNARGKGYWGAITLAVST